MVRRRHRRQEAWAAEHHLAPPEPGHRRSRSPRATSRSRSAGGRTVASSRSCRCATSRLNSEWRDRAVGQAMSLRPAVRESGSLEKASLHLHTGAFQRCRGLRGGFGEPHATVQPESIDRRRPSLDLGRAVVVSVAVSVLGSSGVSGGVAVGDGVADQFETAILRDLGRVLSDSATDKPAAHLATVRDRVAVSCERLDGRSLADDVGSVSDPARFGIRLAVSDPVDVERQLRCGLVAPCAGSSRGRHRLGRHPEAAFVIGITVPTRTAKPA